MCKNKNNPCGCSETDPCKKECTSSKEVCYKGPELPCTNIKTDDTLETVIQKIEEKVCKSTSGCNEYNAILQQNNNQKPIVTVLSNSLLGYINWYRESEGIFVGTLAGQLIKGKTSILITSTNNRIEYSNIDDDTIKFFVYNDVNILSDNFTELSIKVLVCNNVYTTTTTTTLSTICCPPIIDNLSLINNNTQISIDLHKNNLGNCSECYRLIVFSSLSPNSTGADLLAATSDECNVTNITLPTYLWFPETQNDGNPFNNIIYDTPIYIKARYICKQDQSQTSVLSNTVSFIVPSTTTTTTTILPSCCPPVLNSIVEVGSNLALSFTVGTTNCLSCSSIQIDSSSDGINWYGENGTCDSPRLVPKPIVTSFFRLTQFCLNGTIESGISNEITYIVPTTTTSSTSSSTSTSTTSSSSTSTTSSSSTSTSTSSSTTTTTTTLPPTTTTTSSSSSTTTTSTTLQNFTNDIELVYNGVSYLPGSAISHQQLNLQDNLSIFIKNTSLNTYTFLSIINFLPITAEENNGSLYLGATYDNGVSYIHISDDNITYYNYVSGPTNSQNILSNTIFSTPISFDYSAQAGTVNTKIYLAVSNGTVNYLLFWDLSLQ